MICITGDLCYVPAMIEGCELREWRRLACYSSREYCSRQGLWRLGLRGRERPAGPFAHD